MATPMSAKEVLPTLPKVVLEHKHKKKLIINVTGTMHDFVNGKAVATFTDIKKIFAPTVAGDTIQRMIPIKICAYNLKHNLPISVVPQIPLAKSTFVGADGKEYQAVMAPDATIKKISLLQYENKFDERELLAIGKLTPEILSQQMMLTASIPNIGLVTPWLYNVIMANRMALEIKTGRRIGREALPLDGDKQPLYPVDKVIAQTMIDIIKENLDHVPFQKLDKDLSIKFEPLGHTWQEIHDLWHNADSEAEAAFLKMPYTITGVVKYVYAVLD